MEEYKYTFVNPDHERAYREAKDLLEQECERQVSEGKRLMAEWERLPERLRLEKVYSLRQHFAECRRPYEKLLTDIVALCPMIVTVTADHIASPP